MPKLLDTLNLPQDLRQANSETLLALAQEIRDRIIEVVPKTGGHMGTNLGVVELTIALHKVFDFKKDKLVFDVGHQAYPHKLLTGRNKRFDTLRQKDGLCGFPSPWESDYDNFLIGHAGTSISSAFGLAQGYDILKEDKRVVALIGDGSMCGLAFEGLNQAGALKKNLLVVLNDNKMAISPTVGAFSKYLNRVRSGELYHTLMKDIKTTLHHVPMVGESLEHMGERVMMTLRDNLLPDRFFSELGFTYFGPVDGHDLEELLPMLQNLSELEGPLLLHVLTEKGKGASGAAQDPYKYHSPPSPPNKKIVIKTQQSWSGCFADLLQKEAERNPKIVAITAAMAAGTKLEKFIKTYPDRSIDTGIAEGHAVTMAGGLELAGVKPVVLIYSTFLQRAYDNIMHDICLQKSGAVIFALDRAGLVGDDGPSHHGVYDIAYLRHLPRMILMAPRDGEELDLMFQWALLQKQPVAIRYPRGDAPELGFSQARPAIEPGVPEVLKRGSKVALLAYGAMVIEALDAAARLKELDIEATVVNMRFAKPLNPKAYADIVQDHEWLVTLEDHALMGGVGSAFLEMISEAQLKGGQVIRVGIGDEFVSYMSREQQFESMGMDGASICRRVVQAMGIQLCTSPQL
jgi:1-deoxy-D-xylulose-5-phosphate synthase